MSSIHHFHPTGVEKCNALMNLIHVVQMGILNMSPDSFSDGGLHSTLAKAVAHAQSLVAQGAHIIDVGGVSTRPGSRELSEIEELERVIPVLRELRQVLPQNILISLDTSSPEVARCAASDQLIDLINDVFAARKIAESQVRKFTTAHIAAEFKLGLILMHMQGTPETMQDKPQYSDCAEDVCDFLKKRVEFAKSCGVDWLAVDPGIGFGKTLEHNLSLLSLDGMTQLGSLNLPILIGLSRKSLLKAFAERNGNLPNFDNPASELQWRDEQSKLWEKSCILWGARMIRTHVVTLS